MKRKIQCIFAALALLAGERQVAAQGTAFTYQGLLQNKGAPANGSYDFTFALFQNNGSNAVQTGNTITNSGVGVTNGLFAVTLDFGGVFNGANCWLAVGVRSNGGAGFTNLSPMQPVSPAPYAIYAPSAGSAASANSVSASNITGTFAQAQLPSGLVTTNSLSSILGSMAYQSTNSPSFNNGTSLENFNIGGSGDGYDGINFQAYRYTGFGHLRWTNGGSSNWVDIYLNPAHSENGELQVTSAGRIALLCGYDRGHNSALQMASGTFGGGQGDASPTYWPADYIPTSWGDLGGLGYSHLIFWEYGFWSNTAALTSDLGFRVHALDTNGTGAMTFYNVKNQNPTYFQVPGTLAGLEIFGNPGGYGNGVAFHGRETRDIVQTWTAGGQTLGVDWETPEQEIDISGNITFTNVPATWGRTNNVDVKVLDIFSSFNTATATFPDNWSWAGIPPTNLPASNIVEITVKRVIDYNTNYFAKSVTYAYAPILDPTAAAFLASASITNTGQKTAINNFCASAKNKGYFTNLAAFYPLFYQNGTNDSHDLLLAWNGTWHGTLAFSANGVTSDGATGYMDTGLVPSNSIESANSMALGVYVKTPALLAANSANFMGAINIGAELCGLATSSSPGQYFQAEGLNCFCDPSVVGISGSTNFEGVLAVNRTYYSVQTFYVNGFPGSLNLECTADALPTLSLYVFAANTGSAASFSPYQMNVAFVAQNMTAQNMTDLITDINTLNATLGRQ
jgi:hypothetical protein